MDFSKLFLLCFVCLFVVVGAVQAAEKSACPHCGFLNEPDDRYCLKCFQEMRSLTQDEAKEFLHNNRQKVMLCYQNARDHFFKAGNTHELTVQKQNYELSLSYAERTLAQGKGLLSPPAREELKKISWVSRQKLSHLREVLKTPESRIKLIRRGKSYYVKGLLNKAVSVVLVLDTGCSVNLISQETANKLGLREGKEMKVILANGEKVKVKQVILSSVDVGEQSVDDVPVLIGKTNGDGLLGMSFLRHFHFEVNTEHHELILKRK